MTRKIIQLIITACMSISAFIMHTAYAGQDMEVGTITIPATTNNEFQSFTFTLPFNSVPNVFLMTTDDGGDPCTLRIENVTVDGFDAVCLEPENENGAHPGMAVDFIAIVDGVTSVPDNDGGDDVIFESKCIDTNDQIYGPNCDDCSGGQNWNTVNFMTTFGDPATIPAVLTQVQTTANDNPNNADPAFIDVATRNLNATSIQLSNEQMEAGTGPLAEDERICYLAVEVDGCKDLDFSGIGDGGPSSVIFEAARGIQVPMGADNRIDGWTNGCNSGEGAPLSNGCFSSTPIAVAKQTTRRGNNGGMIRRCDVTTTEVRLTYDEDQVSDNDRSHIDEETSALAFGSAFTTPVTLDFASLSLTNRELSASWSTSSETFHLGFNIWGLLDGDWQQLNKAIIPGSGEDVFTRSDYQHSLKLSRYQANNISQFGISSVDVSGFEQFFGPFELDHEYGKSNLAEPIDWQQARTAFNKSMIAKGYHLINGRWKRVRNEQRQEQLNNAAYSIDKEIINIEINENGVYSLTHAEVINLLPNWDGLPIARIGITLNGKNMPRFILSDDNIFNQGDHIIFAGAKAQGYDALFIDSQNYQLRVGKRYVVEATNFDHFDQSNNAELVYLEQHTLTEQKNYSPLITIENPWYDQLLYSTGTAVSHSYNINLTNIDDETAGKVYLRVQGGFDFSGEQDDHHMLVSVNGITVDDSYFDGITEYERHIAIQPGILKEGANSISIELPGDTGYQADVVYIDELNVGSFQTLAPQNYLSFQHVTEATRFAAEVNGPYANDWSVMAYQLNGNLSQIETHRVDAQSISFASLPEQSNSEPTYYALAKNKQWLSPVQISKSRNHDLLSEIPNYLVIAHPQFINETLELFIEDKQDQGHNIAVFDWLDIVNTYGFGNDTPAALDNFLALANDQGDIDNILIVGGHTYDYHKVTSQDIVNFIPTHYRHIGNFGFSPTDVPFADTDNDGLPDIAIGRWPVRSNDDLTYIVKKTADWSTQLNQSTYLDALLIAEAVDGRNLDFKSQISHYVGNPLTTDPKVNNVSTVYLDDMQGQPLSNAQQAITESINEGVQLTSFAGHGSLNSWGFNGILNTDMIKSLTNAGKPTFVMPLACYTTHYESPSVNSLAHQWLFAGDKGAAAVYGAVVLGNHRENAIFAGRLMDEKTKHEVSIGEAIRLVKSRMSANNEMINNWTLLGDPSLAF